MSVTISVIWINPHPFPQADTGVTLGPIEALQGMPLKAHCFSQSTPIGLDCLGWRRCISYSCKYSLCFSLLHSYSDSPGVVEWCTGCWNIWTCDILVTRWCLQPCLFISSMCSVLPKLLLMGRAPPWMAASPLVVCVCVWVGELVNERQLVKQFVCSDGKVLY